MEVGRACRISNTQKEISRIISGRKYGMEINIDKSQVMRVSRSNDSMQIIVNN